MTHQTLFFFSVKYLLMTFSKLLFIINFYIFFFFSFIFISWRPVTSQHCSGSHHTSTQINHGVTCAPHPDPTSHLPLHPIPLGHPSAPGPRLVSCIQPGLVICFTLDNIHVSMLFSQNIPPLPSPTESKILCGNFLKNWN